MQMLIHYMYYTKQKMGLFVKPDFLKSFSGQITELKINY